MENKPPIKKPTTFEEQVNILKKRKMDIPNSEFAEKILSRVNYYRLSAYMLTFKNGENFIEGTSFNKIVSIYEFDRKLRLLMLEVLENIEIAFRTHIAYLIAHKYGPLGYEDKTNFINSDWHDEFISELERLVSINRKKELFIEHYYQNYLGKFPIWVAIEVTSFGTISKLFKNLKEEDKKTIANSYYNVPYKYIESWLQTLTYIRNVCAHYGRIYYKKLPFRPLLFRNEKSEIDNHKFFSALYVATRLITKLEGDRLLTELEALINEFEEQIDLSCLGIPLNWKDLLSKNINK